MAWTRNIAFLALGILGLFISQLNAPSKLLSSAFCSQRPASLTVSRTMASQPIIDAIKLRRSHYLLAKELPLSTSAIDELVKKALYEVPSAFNSQTTRVVVLHGAQHEKLWDIVTSALKAKVPEDKWAPTGEKMKNFKGAAGTILFFEDQSVVKNLQENIPSYADKFPTWAAQSDGMLQFTLWTALATEGIGGNLQHYNPLIDDEVAKTWDIPSSWALNAQLVFGGKVDEPAPKERIPFEDRFKSYM